jgi:hypothetical protein
MVENKTPRPETNDETSSVFEISEDGFQKYSRLMLKNQNFFMGIIGGLAAFIAGVGLWTGTMLLLSYKLDWMALGVGLMIGFSVRLLGKGVEWKFGIIGAILAFFGSISGNLLTACIIFSHGKSISLFSVILQLTPKTELYFLKAVIGPFDVIFCIGAILIGYYFAFKPLKGQ